MILSAAAIALAQVNVAAAQTSADQLLRTSTALTIYGQPADHRRRGSGVCVHAEGQPLFAVSEIQRREQAELAVLRQLRRNAVWRAAQLERRHVFEHQPFR